MDQVSPVRCPRCGAEVPPTGAEGLCPACLMAGALEASGRTGAPGTDDVSHSADPHPPRLATGQVFGRYRVEHLIGRGGMGEVYAAEQVDNGRRMALKVLNERLSDAQDRARFLREGQLAASISHPNSVYIFGSEEIDGIPVITMELLPGGTLKDAVKSRGPLPPAAAVDAMLQVLAGLDAAQSAGVLHRDVKPGNCFTDVDGTVKVGDFGLSISTLARDVTQSVPPGAFRGTPQFASPEQLRGGPLDVRADIYSAGATLFYLLTGRPPFEERELTALVARVAAESPPSPRDLQPAVPRGLARTVLRCLAKEPASRPASYAALSAALQPYASRTSTPAPLGLRWVAGLIDYVLLILPVVEIQAVRSTWTGSDGFASRPEWQWYYLAGSVAYFAILEGVWGTTVGKWCCGLRVVRAHENRRIGSHALLRSVLYHLANLVVALPFVAVGSHTAGLAAALIGFVPPLYTAALFLTARRHNGFAAVHDLLTRTRVIARTRAPRPAIATPILRRATPANIPTSRCGPFDIVAPVGSTTEGQLFAAFDPTLRRTVWVHRMPAGAEPVPPERRDVARPGRLRWIGGARTSSEAWDAYEALDGDPLAQRLGRPASWNDVKRWLRDVAVELRASAAVDATPPLRFSRVFVTTGNAAKILDFDLNVASHSGDESGATTEAARTPQRFLHAIAQRALLWPAGDQNDHVESLRLPLSARSLLERLAHERFESLNDVAAACHAVMGTPDRVTRSRRAAHVAVMAIPLALVMLLVAMTEPLLDRIATSDESKDASTLAYFLHLLDERARGTPPTFLKTTELDALDVYVAGRFGTVLADAQTWDSPRHLFLASKRSIATAILARHPRVSADELHAATTTLEKFLADHEETERATTPPPLAWWELPATLVGWILILTAIPALLSAAAFKGGLVLSGFGMAVVRRDGSEVTRGRALWRALIGWSPALMLLAITAVYWGSLFMRASMEPVGSGVFYWMLDHISLERVSAMVVIILALGAACAVLTPQRGLQDRLAGTWLVPR